ncbi:hypothetical protein KPH14_005213 [Odynerus spinipes]|uniref:Uncharacterized protein n=1 Tax=Odynerus spinipes TaxID=1348599 RepID=A0AAD9RKV3_9HYME|nr:hypothetical protein KPH14_005213 [Odynerus spinipes]
MANECVCTKCYHPKCPPANTEPPYNEVSHEIGDTRISIKVAKERFDSSKSTCAYAPNIDIGCTDAHGKKCREGCTKVNVIPNEEPPPKTPDEKMFLLKSTRQITASDDLKSTLELEFKLPRNYLPLPKLDPPPIIVPRTIVHKTLAKSVAILQAIIDFFKRNYRNMNFLITLLLYLINFPNGYTQVVSQKDVGNYLNTLTTLMWQALKDYGISNLPDVDTKVTYNKPKAYGYSLVGNLYFEDGFVMDISSVVMFSKENRSRNTDDEVRIAYDMKFEGLRILRDFRYESEEGHIADRSFGNVVITPAIVQVNIAITKYFENNTIKVECPDDLNNYQPGVKLLKFYPENGLTIRLRKHRERSRISSHSVLGLIDVFGTVVINGNKELFNRSGRDILKI